MKYKKEDDDDDLFDDLEEKKPTIVQDEDDEIIDETLAEDLKVVDEGAEAEEEDDIDIMFKFNTNKHKMEGKHALKRDTIFKGKVDEVESGPEEFFLIPEEININDGLPIEAGSNYEFESKHNEDYISRQNLAKDVHDMLEEKTDLDFSCNRRKPNRQAFNDYYKMLLNHLGKSYTKSEIFVELSYYFTDNIFNMFKLLDKEYATQIIIELKQSDYLDNLNNINFI